MRTAMEDEEEVKLYVFTVQSLTNDSGNDGRRLTKRDRLILGRR
jgi:hypothetical protein